MNNTKQGLFPVVTGESNNGEIFQQEPKGKKAAQSKTIVKLLKRGLQTRVKQQHLFTEGRIVQQSHCQNLLSHGYLEQEWGKREKRHRFSCWGVPAVVREVFF